MGSQALVKEICPTTTQEWMKIGFPTKGNSSVTTGNNSCCSTNGCC